MSKAYHTNQSVKTSFSLEFFGTNGSATITGTPIILVTKIITSCGKSKWGLLHQN
ncbi:MAG: hypothetical protein HKP14_07360 [Bacteroidia bacterium]|nr:hypothetical protein [Bacteroidia bacterium]